MTTEGVTTIVSMALVAVWFIATDVSVRKQWREFLAEWKQDQAKIKAERRERAALASSLHRANAFECGRPCCKERRLLRERLRGDVR